ncbi:MAG: carboxypeptidase M32 [Rubritalea sp.]|uniref:carboxypeptidase M32 n=1 Tax=Rubritalea sp. TaxID=2109375 RepID=UPI003242BFC8
MSDAYASLVIKHREIALVHSSSSTLAWDQETNLPDKAQAYRAEQIAYLSGKAHELSTSDNYEKLLASAEDSNDGSHTTLANLREWRHSFERSTQLNRDIVERDSKTSSHAKTAWIKAREQSNFSLFAPHMQKLLDLAKEKAELWGYQDETYDALLENYERGAKTRDIISIFNRFQPAIISLASDAVAKSSSNNPRKLEGPFPVEKQQELNRAVAQSIGFDLHAGRIDTTTHPFCTTLGPSDVRLTTRYYEQDFTTSLLGVMHEAGHGLYEQGLLESNFGLPSGSAISLGIHESQSLLWEAHVGRSIAFWQHWLPKAQELFPQLRDWTVEEFLQTINQATYSPIRVDADEATYDLHVLLRFNIERQLVRGDLDVKDIPAAWNESFETYFNMRPKSDSEGCLQDIHWAMGGLGYFPTYTLGNLNASQLFHAATQDASILNSYNKADFTPLLQWMRKEIHSHGSTLLPQDLMVQATGESTNPSHHLKHLSNRFLK